MARRIRRRGPAPVGPRGSFRCADTVSADNDTMTHTLITPPKGMSNRDGIDDHAVRGEQCARGLVPADASKSGENPDRLVDVWRPCPILPCRRADHHPEACISDWSYAECAGYAVVAPRPRILLETSRREWHAGQTWFWNHTDNADHRTRVRSLRRGGPRCVPSVTATGTNGQANTVGRAMAVEADVDVEVDRCPAGIVLTL